MVYHIIYERIRGSSKPWQCFKLLQPFFLWNLFNNEDDYIFYPGTSSRCDSTTLKIISPSVSHTFRFCTPNAFAQKFYERGRERWSSRWLWSGRLASKVARRSTRRSRSWMKGWSWKVSWWWLKVTGKHKMICKLATQSFKNFRDQKYRILMFRDYHDSRDCRDYMRLYASMFSGIQAYSCN